MIKMEGERVKVQGQTIDLMAELAVLSQREELRILLYIQIT